MAPKSIFIFVPSGRGVAKTRVLTAPRPPAPLLRLNNCFLAVPFAADSGVLRMAIINQLSGPANASLKSVVWRHRIRRAPALAHPNISEEWNFFSI
ncbi:MULTISPECIES: hypothetical protein [Agrobacterium]|uniref:hypothetical protein n=1 Tax=Agrobacterium TaxID=357 RepID=UPI000FE30E04|nr:MULTISPECIES: hypothetical protein [Agrobacterium]KAB0457387.1 hypothetical protein F7R04_22840 [Agrobacterium tumefaciens]MDR6591261.1 hypothetical protein [Agrobacterium tumefaciens]NIB13270.1 hypothetical protein [Agrobacterium radiobacter]NSZ34798.1 hypothetical protein [Agrobacterium tumefaciens]QLG24543.1 hypothetical protein EML4_19410 [Agrobacterium tumefaciens]